MYKSEFQIANEKLEKHCLKQMAYYGKNGKATKVREYRKLLKIARRNLIPVSVPKTFFQRLLNWEV